MLLLMQPQRVQFFCLRFSVCRDLIPHEGGHRGQEGDGGGREREDCATGRGEVNMPQMRPLMWAQGGVFAVFLTHSSPQAILVNVSFV